VLRDHKAAPILFSDVFAIDTSVIDEYGAFDISLVSDLPLFIDPFLLFNSEKAEYKQLHEDMIGYLRFLRDKVVYTQIDDDLLKAWFYFTEVKQTWLGFTESSNEGRGLGPKFARALRANFSRLFAEESLQVTRGQHLEKLCLISDGVGRDCISDFTTNLIKGFLLEYTQRFARDNIDARRRRMFTVRRAVFSYRTESWVAKPFDLPAHDGDFVLLVPQDLLARDDTWINGADLVRNFHELPESISDETLRAEINNYFKKQLPEYPEAKQVTKAIRETIIHFPELIDFFIKFKEDTGDRAVSISELKVRLAYDLFVRNAPELREMLAEGGFYDLPGDSYTNALKRVNFLKHVIESNDGYRLFWNENGEPIKREKDLQVIYRLTWFGSAFDANREVNNGRGPVDYKVSKGSADMSLVEFKLASNTQLERNLQKQVEVYEKANQTDKSIKVIMFFTDTEEAKVDRILLSLELDQEEAIILIDARNDNKPSGSKA
jgi:hypothetical protein